MNRDEIWEHQDGSHWRILAVDLPGHYSVCAYCVKGPVSSQYTSDDRVERFEKDAFIHQVIKPRELCLFRPRDSKEDTWVENKGLKIRGDQYEYMRVREVMSDE